MTLQRAAIVVVTAVLGVTMASGCTGSTARPQGSPDSPARADGQNKVIVPGGPGEPARTMAAEKLDPAQRAATANQADHRFISMMIPHHHQALVMARLAPERSSSERVRGLAARIKDAQRVEIEAMHAWQKRNDAPVTNAKAAYRQQLRHPEHLAMMGMATPQQLNRLERSDGRDFDELFLRLMTAHHKGAVDMAETVLAQGRHVGVRQLAQDMLVTQRDEIARMRAILSSLSSDT